MAIGRRSGVYSPVSKYYVLSAPKVQGGSRVAILKCEHAVLANGNHPDPATRYCDLCSRAAKAAALKAPVASRPPAPAKPEKSVLAEIAQTLAGFGTLIQQIDQRLTQVEDAKTTPATPTLKVAE